MWQSETSKPLERQLGRFVNDTEHCRPRPAQLDDLLFLLYQASSYLANSSFQGTAPVGPLVLGAGTQAMQQLSGINVTSYHLPTALTDSVGLESKLARLLVACNSVSYLLCSFIVIPNVERWGRPRLLIFGATGQCFCYLMITVLLKVF